MALAKTWMLFSNYNISEKYKDSCMILSSDKEQTPQF